MNSISSAALAVAAHTLNDSRKTPASQHGNRQLTTRRGSRESRRGAYGPAANSAPMPSTLDAGIEAAELVAALTQRLRI